MNKSRKKIPVLDYRFSRYFEELFLKILVSNKNFMEFFINPGIVKVNQRPVVADSINDEFLLSKGLLNFRCKQKSSNKITTRPVLLQYTF